MTNNENLPFNPEVDPSAEENPTPSMGTANVNEPDESVNDDTDFLEDDEDFDDEDIEDEEEEELNSAGI